MSVRLSVAQSGGFAAARGYAASGFPPASENDGLGRQCESQSVTFFETPKVTEKNRQRNSEHIQFALMPPVFRARMTRRKADCSALASCSARLINYEQTLRAVFSLPSKAREERGSEQYIKYVNDRVTMRNKAWRRKGKRKLPTDSPFPG